MILLQDFFLKIHFVSYMNKMDPKIGLEIGGGHPKIGGGPRGDWRGVPPHPISTNLGWWARKFGEAQWNRLKMHKMNVFQMLKYTQIIIIRPLKHVLTLFGHFWKNQIFSKIFRFLKSQTGVKSQRGGGPWGSEIHDQKELGFSLCFSFSHTKNIKLFFKNRGPCGKCAKFCVESIPHSRYPP